VLAVDINKTTK